MSFRDMVEHDNVSVFGNTSEFADLRTLCFDGMQFDDVPCVISKLKAKDRPVLASDHAQGLFLVTGTLHYPLSYTDGNVPEKGIKMKISDDTGFLRMYFVAQSACDHGMVRLELEAIDE